MACTTNALAFFFLPFCLKNGGGGGVVEGGVGKKGRGDGN